MHTNVKSLIEDGQTYLGIELGSTRIKSVLIDTNGNILAKGSFEWENHFVNGIWTYPLDEVWAGIAKSYQDLCKDVQVKYAVVIKRLSAIGISAMMHGYLPFDSQERQLCEFRTWRNNTTAIAADQLTELLHYNIPQRWSVAHLYQAILDQESHTQNIAYITTLAGYVHWQLTGKKVLGIGDASGMFPIDSGIKDYDIAMTNIFNQLISDKGFTWQLEDILPNVLLAGDNAGILTERGAKLIDPSGNLQAGCILCPPEGDAGTGMMATNSIKVKTGNVSAGTSAFAMVVLEKPLSKVYRDLDMVTTPAGELVAMAHSQNCSSDLNAWFQLFGEILHTFNVDFSMEQLYGKLFDKALEANPDGGGLLSYCFYSGEHGVDLTTGCPLFLHPANAKFSLANFVLVQLYTSFGAMKLGMDTLTKKENVEIEKIFAHGGLFKSKDIAQRILAAALNVPVALLETASEGGAWGIALLAAYTQQTQLSLTGYLDQIIFSNTEDNVANPDAEWVRGYENFIQRYKDALPIEQMAADFAINN
ncbi:ATPase [Testudinibacter sp. TR-2022]|uniref:xylulokinase n=1 Tax=Testudinibacter sp. TR-2022 TaxID=2585029 RepID=UPI00111B3B29|nr:FGGY-family carbohydrate kinase [Testudinibacter sp. TR-2022]TNH00813.1 ATPase [Pasteurellaceae bacterium Phil31]TNH07296.1 ATPase [Testudinibacter sp. TR-2022]TNH09201.1 ATPase [Testudinibacter sp. TR-2022]TNH14490.1 ATPase [Testudinibacter sp. TR-2022]TNH15012.1 ATPase [Testudinibacter sp. TR-2022]